MDILSEENLDWLGNKFIECQIHEKFCVSFEYFVMEWKEGRIGHYLTDSQIS